MKNAFKLMSVVLVSICLTIGCASTKITNQRRLVTGQLPKPNNAGV